MKYILDRVFFVPSRQIVRRWKSYLSVFFTSIVLMILVISALELFEAYWLRSVEDTSVGTHHVVILGQLYDLTEKIENNRHVESVDAIPAGAWLSTSAVLSSPAQVTVENDDIDAKLDIHYLWGGPPGDGEIALPLNLYRAMTDLRAGEVNDFWFSASRMVYEPLRLAGIYTVSGVGNNYLFVSRADYEEINSGTGAVNKFNHYIRVKHATPRLAARTAAELFRDLNLLESDVQERYRDETSPEDQWRDYLNLDSINMEVRYKATPVTLWVLPIAALAALVLAYFMIEWCRGHADEFGVLASLGANRWELCLIAAGQILILSAVSAVPVVLLSALLSNTYFKVYNKVVSSGISFAFTIPWPSLIKTALAFVCLSALFTFLGIARMTKGAPWPLMSGSAEKSRQPIRLGWGKWFFEERMDPRTALALNVTLRRIRSEVVPAIVGALTASILGVFLLVFLTNTSYKAFFGFGTPNIPADLVLSARHESGIVDAKLTDRTAEEILQDPGVSSCIPFSSFGRDDPVLVPDVENPTFKVADTPLLRTVTTDKFGNDQQGEWLKREIIVTGPELLPDLRDGAIEETASFADWIEDGDGILVLLPPDKIDSELRAISAGDRIEAVPECMIRQNGTLAPIDAGVEFTVKAVAALNPDQDLTGHVEEAVFVLSRKGGERLGLVSADACNALLVRFDETADAGLIRNTVESLNGDVNLMRYEITNLTVKSRDEKAAEQIVSLLILIFFTSLLLAFCVTARMRASIRVSRERKEYAVLRQMGADEKDLLRYIRCESWPGIVLTVMICSAVLLSAAILYLLLSMRSLNTMAAQMPRAYTAAVYAKYRGEIFARFGKIVSVWLLTFFAHLLTGFIMLSGGRGPLKKTMRKTVAEEIRKDTD